MQANHSPRLAAEMLATSDALNHLRTQLSRLIAAGDLAITGRPETSVVLVQGLDVANALQVLASKIDGTR